MTFANQECDNQAAAFRLACDIVNARDFPTVTPSNVNKDKFCSETCANAEETTCQGSIDKQFYLYSNDGYFL